MSYFQTKTRDSGETFVTLADDAPGWVRDAVYAAHDGEMPNDWRFATCEAIFDGLDDDDYDDESELADSLVDVYNHDLYAWAAPQRWGCVDEAAEQFGDFGGVSSARRLIRGQLLCIEQMVEIIAEAVEENRDGAS